ncbi:YncE family protein [Cytobacillus sp. Hz8]|uniref:YncE family protein n=1 Tax=Cytobacillus sp. Hz8 TaxID=3347168 RepID=UPI0035E36D52
MKLLIKLLLCLPIFLLASCQYESYPKISKNQSIVATVNIKDMSVTFVDMKAMKKLATWDLKKPYSGGLMLPDGDTLLLYGKQVDSIDLYSLAQGKKINSWDIGKGIVNGALINHNHEIVFSDQFNHIVRFFTLKGKEIIDVKTEQNPLTLLENKKKGQLNVISYSSEKMSTIDIKTKKTINTIKIHSQAAGAMIDEKRDEIWIGGHGEGLEPEKYIHVYDEKGKLVRKIHAPIMPVNFLKDENYIFVLSHGSSTLHKLSVTGKPIKSVVIGANPFEMVSFHDEIIVAGYDSNDIHIVDPRTLQIKKTIKVDKGPFQLIVREGQKQ